jgi:ABC-type sugar transport system substrate-binding protein
MVRFNARLSAEAAALVEAHATAANVPAWKVLDTLILAGLKDTPPPEPPPQLPQVVRDLAQEAVAFLASHEDRRAASKALRKAWERAILLADHDLKGRVPEG